ncbi:SOS response-associated peptidase family protein [Sorangium sp. So ce362]|uniref:SOS response-associated peptidase family protein n=1 Tax=Sorangium sp. So ce362 TaxID=3133303 RepID=UPI003F621686
MTRRRHTTRPRHADARAEDLEHEPLWRGALERYRCFVSATGWREFKAAGKKTMNLRAHATVVAMAWLAACSSGSSEPPLPAPSGGASGMSAADASSVAGGASGSAAQAGAAGGSGGAAAVAGSAGAAGTSNAGGAAGAGGASAGAGGAGACPAGSTQLSPWPGKAEVRTLDREDAFERDLSGLTYEAPGVLWATDNLSAKLFRLLKSGGSYAPDTSKDWASGKRLHYPNGKGTPDAEGVTFAATSAAGVYVCAERDADDSSVSRLSVLRYDVTAAGATLTATHEWNLTALLPEVGANAGLEAITWAADSLLTAHRFFDESKARAYVPSDYGEHGAGLFLVGVEQTGKVYAFALNHESGAATLVASISTPLGGVMGLELDRDTGRLWAYCDDTCDNQSAVLGIDDALGRFVLERRFTHPGGLPDSNNEGIALAPDAECSGGVKPFFWTDDADADGFSVREGSLACGCL